MSEAGKRKQHGGGGGESRKKKFFADVSIYLFYCNFAMHVYSN